MLQTKSETLTVVGARLPSAPPPKVSVAMTTYNHERFIRQAVESVMAQKTNFPYELVLSEDGSPDQTRAICIELQIKYPGRIRLLLPERRLGAKQSMIRNLLACDGTYIALLDGDDFWTHAGKLQLQADVLDANPHYSGCFTSARVIPEDDPTSSCFIPGDDSSKLIYTTADILAKNYMATSSTMYRNFMHEIDFGPVMDLVQTDWPLQVFASLRGPIGFLPELTTAYRLHDGGLWTGMDEAARREAKYSARKAIANLVPEHHRRQATRLTTRFCQQTAEEMLRQGARSGARTWIRRSLSCLRLRDIFYQRSSLRRSMIVLAATFLPRWTELSIAAEWLDTNES